MKSESMKPRCGIVSAGHDDTADAAAQMLSAGGNAFEAAMAALCTACVAEPVLASLGGGGFLLAKRAGAAPILYDFFTQTPHYKRPADGIVFYPIQADFGDTTQEFHIGMGSIAVPGAIAGLCQVQRDLCRMSLAEIVAYGADLADGGVVVNPFQHGISIIVEAILRSSPEVFALHASPAHQGVLALPGERVRNPDLSRALHRLADEGADLFYRGEWARQIAEDCRRLGGHLSETDLGSYQVVKRNPLSYRYRGEVIHTNPPPSLGGMLISFSMQLLESSGPAKALYSSRYLHTLGSAMLLTQALRSDERAEVVGDSRLQDSALVAEYLALMAEQAIFPRGTTQISVADCDGNLASLTLSNGEGAGYVLPGTGIVLNNMLGEEDINPHGFHRWPADRRISSMMAPTLLERPGGDRVVTGSSGSNRIRSAVLQVLCNLVDHGLGLEEAVSAPRIHYEDGILNIEPPIPDAVLQDLRGAWPDIRLWSGQSVFFGGAHSVACAADGGLCGAGDPRRGGVVRVV